MRVHEVMRQHPATVEPTTTIADARRLAEAEGVRHLVVTEGKRVCGVIEEDGLWLAAEDVLRTAAGLQGSLTARETRPVRTAMHPADPVLSPHESLATAAKVMLVKGRTAIPVVDGGHLMGILTVDECRKAVGAPLMALPGPDAQGQEAQEGQEPEHDKPAESSSVA